MAKRLVPLAAALCVAAAAGCAPTTAGTALPAPPIPPTTAETLPGLLLSADDVGAILDAKDIVVSGEVSEPWNDATHFQTAAQSGCLAIAGAAQKAVYNGAGWTALRGQVLREGPTAPQWSRFATQAVVLFGDDAAAAAFLDDQQIRWAGCSNRELRYTQPMMPDQVWAVGPTRAEQNTLTVSREQTGPQHWFCQRALAVRATVGVDVEACSLDGPTTAAAEIARRIGDRLPSA